MIFDVGSQHGHTTLEYLNAFPRASVYGFEADAKNFPRALAATERHRSRCQISHCAIAAEDGEVTFHVNSHNGTHSLLEIGDVQYFQQPAHLLEVVRVRAQTLDAFAQAKQIERIDIVKMDIQGAEVEALKGAANLIDSGRIKLLALEASFQSLYKGQPLFGDLCSYLHERGYSLFQMYDLTYHLKNPNTLCWADAIFLSPEMTAI